MNIKVGPKEVWFQTGFTVQIGISYFRKKEKKNCKCEWCYFMLS